MLNFICVSCVLTIAIYFVKSISYFFPVVYSDHCEHASLVLVPLERGRFIEVDRPIFIVLLSLGNSSLRKAPMLIWPALFASIVPTCDIKNKIALFK